MLGSWVWSIHIANIVKLPKEIYRFNSIPINIPMIVFTELEQITLKFVGRHKCPPKPNNLEKEKEESNSLTSDYTINTKQL